MDLWEANSEATALTAHPCDIVGIYGCTGSSCGSSGVCDEDGCGWNPYAEGNETFYGPGLTVDTSDTFTVTTQFVTDDGTTSGTLSEIRRYYIQNGEVIANAVSTSFSGLNYIDETFCTDTDSYTSTVGGLPTTGDALSRGMVLIFSIWQDDSAYMNWLDSGSAGPCSSTAGDPSTILADDPGTSVTWSNIKWGDIGSTGSAPGVSSSSSSSSTTSTTTKSSSSSTTSVTTTTKSSSSTSTTKVTSTTTASGATQTEYGQCGGIGWTGPTVCASPYTCTDYNAYYYQCVPS